MSCSIILFSHLYSIFIHPHRLTSRYAHHRHHTNSWRQSRFHHLPRGGSLHPNGISSRQPAHPPCRLSSYGLYSFSFDSILISSFFGVWFCALYITFFPRNACCIFFLSLQSCHYCHM